MFGARVGATARRLGGDASPYLRARFRSLLERLGDVAREVLGRAVGDQEVVLDADAAEGEVLVNERPVHAVAIAVATGGVKVPGVPQGWCYKGYHHQLKYCKSPDTPYTSMTAGAVGAVTIYDYILGADWKKDKTVQNGVAWLVKNWSWSENVGPCEISNGTPKAWLYYGFYAVERVGMLCDTPLIGGHDWYREGATVILDAQAASGAWNVSDAKKPTWDTCFAILFLKRATRPLDVASEDKSRRK
jgi:hypothetical protein